MHSIKLNKTPDKKPDFNRMTNEQILRRMLKELDPVYHAIVRERLWTSCKLALQDIEKHPEKWEKAFIHPDFMKRACIEIKKHLFDEKKEAGDDVNNKPKV
jgi:hypothetical protein